MQKKRQATITHEPFDIEAQPEEWRRYYERRLQEIRSGAWRNTERLWMFDDLEQLARELPDKLRGIA